MLNAAYKKDALNLLQQANEKYSETYKATLDNVTSLHEKRLASVKTIKAVENYVMSLANRPRDYDKTLGEIKVRRQKFESEVKKLELESKKTDQVSGTIAGAGALAGVGVAAFGPSAAMAVAMTFGTASTGTAIATLSGAAATNAALAWLGGGALTIGGAGMSGGSAFLALAGPVGWAIGGVALVGGGLLASCKNKKIAEKAESSARTIKKETERIQEMNVKVNALKSATTKMDSQLSGLLKKLRATGLTDYHSFDDDQVHDLMKLMNTAEALSKKIGEIVG